MPHFSDSASSTPAAGDFRPPTIEEMRLLWRSYPDPDVRRLLREIAHLRGVLAAIESLRQSIDHSWKAEAGGQLAALYHLSATHSPAGGTRTDWHHCGLTKRSRFLRFFCAPIDK
jgi:hypothetical protein